MFPPCACPAGGSEQAGRPRSRQVARRLAIRVAAGQRELLSLRQASQPIAPYGVNDLRSPVCVPLVVFCVVSGHDIRRENIQSPTDSTPTLWPPFGHRIVEKRQSGAGIVQHEMWGQGRASGQTSIPYNPPLECTTTTTGITILSMAPCGCNAIMWDGADWMRMIAGARDPIVHAQRRNPGLDETASTARSVAPTFGSGRLREGRPLCGHAPTGRRFTRALVFFLRKCPSVA